MNSIQKFWHMLERTERRSFLWLLCVSICSALLQMAGIASVFPFIAMIANPATITEQPLAQFLGNLLPIDTPQNMIWYTGIFVFILVIASNVLVSYSSYISLRFAFLHNHRLSHRLLQQYLTRPYEFFLSTHSAELSNRVLLEVNQLTYRFVLPLHSLVVKGLVCIVILSFLIYIHPFASIVAAGIFGSLYAIIYMFLAKKLRTLGMRRLAHNQNRSKVVSEAFGGIKELKILHRESQFLSWYQHISLQMAADQSYAAIVSQIPKYILEAMAFGTLVLYVLLMVSTGTASADIIALTGMFAFAGYRLLPALQDVFHAVATMRFNAPVLEKIASDLDAPSSPSEELTASNPLTFYRDIVFSEVSYRYPGSTQNVLEKISLTIPKQSKVAIVGVTGVGKTTLVDILLGLLDSSSGEVLIDNVPLDAHLKPSWQQTIGYVSQHVFIQDATIAENIAFGYPIEEIDMKRVEEVATIAELDRFIKTQLPLHYETVVGERGVRLSGGQRQRIGIARALYRNAEVLVFDEATNALDQVTEETVFRALFEASYARTLVMIAHRLSTVRDCDTIFLLDGGTCIDSGTYDQLLQRSQLFRSMAHAEPKKQP